MHRVIGFTIVVIGFWLSAGFGNVAPAEEIGYVEDFALAADRSEALKLLVPGTEDHYYFHCLYYQQTEQFAKVPDQLKLWKQRHGETARVREIENRQALLTYPQTPKPSLEFLRQRLNLHFNHQRELLGEKPNLPSALDQTLITRDRLTQLAFNRHGNLQGFEDRALDWLIAQNLNNDRRRELLKRLTRPDYPNLAKLVVADLETAYSGGFGSFEIHRQLLLSQLDECLKLKPDLRNQTNFVNTYLGKLHPNPDVDWRNDPKAHQEYLTRLWDYVETLAPVHNSLRAHVLYQRLKWDETQGVYNKERFLAYLQLPRPMPYVDRDYLNREESRRYPVNLQADFSGVTLFPIVGLDEPLVRRYLAHFFREETTWQPYALYVEDNYLKQLFAETKIVNGLGDEEQWASLLPPAAFQALKERIDLDFAPTNKTQFAPEDVVSLDLDVKHVKTLIIKVFEINTDSYYREHLKEIDTDVNLDGLVPNAERTVHYNEPPLRRVRRHFEFPELKGRGVFVIDFIGNGKSSRALVRKGRLHSLVRTSVAGQVFTVLNEKNQIVPEARLWLGGQLYQTDEDGAITVPFTNQAQAQRVILCSGNFCSLDTFSHEAEQYQLRAGFFVDRESLLKRRMAKLLIRPQLLLNGLPAPLSILEDVELSLLSTDQTGIATAKIFKGEDVKLHLDRETVVEFRVPERLAKLQYVLKAKVKNLSTGKTDDLAAGDEVTLNQIDQTEKTEQLFLARVGGEYLVSLLGKTGEALSDRAVQFKIKHRDFRDEVPITLETDPQGFVRLGRLQHVERVTATSPQQVQANWPLIPEQHTQPQHRHGKVGEPIQLAFMTDQQQPAREELSLLELRGNTFVADRFEALSLKNGLLFASDLPRGDYDLLLKSTGERLRLRVTAGDVARGFVLGPYRHLQLIDPNPLQISAVSLDEKTMQVQLQNDGKNARVHVFATRYEPAFSAFAELAAVRPTEPGWILAPTANTSYVAGRNIGDEYRYILERKYAPRYPGNSLDRPSLLLNPWAIRKTETTQQESAPGDDFLAGGDRPESERGRAPETPPPPSITQDFSNLDFLANASVVLLNLRPDENGRIAIPREELGEHQELHMVAVDLEHTVSRHVSLPAVMRQSLDLRLASGFDPEVHFTQRKHISILKAGEAFEVADLSTAKFENYDSLAQVYQLYATLSQDSKLREFRFILDWPTLKPEEQRAKYSKYACHELNFFLFKKDPQFFAKVVRPYLENKKDKTFLDRWLVGAELAEDLTPWEYHQLNVVERILLSQQIRGEQLYTKRHVQDVDALTPPDLDYLNRLFATALNTTSLEGSAIPGLEKARSKLNRDRFEFGKAMTEELEMMTPGEPQAAPMPSDAADKTPSAAKPGSRTDDKEAKQKKVQREARDQAKGDAMGNFEQAEADLDRRKEVRQLYRILEKTQEWVENNYYHLPLAEHQADLITATPFWTDYAAHAGQTPFFSDHFAEASRNFPEMMFALSVLDLPFVSPEHETQFAESRMTLKAAGPIVVFHEEIEPAKSVAKNSPLLVSENFFRHGDRYRHENGEQTDKFLTDEFLTHVVYGCQVVVTNPTSARQKLEVLLQIPVGAISVLNGQATRSVLIDLAPFNVQTLEYYFYFPAAGNAAHYPVQVARNEEIVAHGEPFTLLVVNEPSTIDRHSWPYLSQYGSEAEVLAYLNDHNLERTDLDKIAFRMRDEDFFGQVISLLAKRHAYNATLWSYGIYHDTLPVMRQYLKHNDAFVAQTGDYLDSRPLTIDPVARKTYEHRDYRPLVNARRHPLGRQREILNDRFHEQYHHLLKVLCYHSKLNDEQRMAVVYYLLLQDRVAEGLAFFEQVNPANLKTRLQYDYFAAYVAMYRENLEQAEEIAARHAEHPVDRWRNAFANVSNQLEEIAGADAKIADAEDQQQGQAKLAATEKAFDFTLEGAKVVLRYQNLTEVRVNYYLMNVELLFSRNPFVQKFSGQFSAIRPNQTQTQKLPADQTQFAFDIPETLHKSNVLVEIVGGGDTQTNTYYANSLSVQIVENYGHLKVREAKTGRPEAKVYVKVYARMKDGRERFYKDGYTDLRGQFDYVSLSTDELQLVDGFSILILSEENGAIVRETPPPKR